MPSVTALRRWLVFVAVLRLFSVGLGYLAPWRLRTNVYSLRPGEVTDLTGRTFATWTLTTCALCLFCARDPTNPGVYGATLLSFAVAAAHFGLELCVYGTLGWGTAAQPLAVAALSAGWMGLGWNYYTSIAARTEPTVSEEVTLHAGGRSKDE